MTFVAGKLAVLRCQSQIDADRSSTLTTTPTKPPLLRRVVRGAQLEWHLVLVAQIDALDVAACRPQKFSRWPNLRPSRSTGTMPSSIIDGVAHSEVIGRPSLCATRRRKPGTGPRGLSPRGR